MRPYLLALLALGCEAERLPECEDIILAKEVRRETDCPEPYASMVVRHSRPGSLKCEDDVSWVEPATCDAYAHGFCSYASDYSLSATGRTVGDVPKYVYTIRFRELGCRVLYELESND